MKTQLIPVLVCPHCRQAVRFGDEAIVCENCAASFHSQQGIPVFLSEPAEVIPEEHESNAMGEEFEAILRGG